MFARPSPPSASGFAVRPLDRPGGEGLAARLGPGNSGEGLCSPSCRNKEYQGMTVSVQPALVLQKGYQGSRRRVCFCGMLVLREGCQGT